MSTLDDYKIYIHRERGFVYLPLFANMKSSEVLDLRIEGFCFIPNKQLGTDKFGRKISICTAEGEVFAGINLTNGKVFFDTTMGLQKMLNKLIDSLTKAGYKINNPEAKHGYVEICARFPREMVGKSYVLLKKISIIFRTKKTNTIRKRHDSLDCDWLYLVKNILFGKYIVNVKVYLAVKYAKNKCDNNRIIGFDNARLPKIEVQITKPKNIHIAKNEAIPIIIAFLKTLGCSGNEMIEEDYEKVRFAEKNAEGYQQIFLQFNKFENKQERVFVDKKNITERGIKITQLLYEKPRSVKEIKNILKVSENTIRIELSKLIKEKIIYSRGRKGVQIMYAVRLQP